MSGSSRSWARGLAAVLATAATLSLAVMPTGSLRAEEVAQPTVSIRLVGQTPVATPRRPFRITVAVTHTGGQALDDLVVALWIYNPARSRSAYQAGIEDEPPTEPLLVTTFEQSQGLTPAETKVVTIRRKLPELEARAENALYPVKVQVESGGVALGALRSTLVYIQERPLVPLNVSLAFVLDAPLRFRPDGTLLDTTLERELAAGGRLETIVAALERHPVRSTLAVSPLLVEQLDRMSGGYRILDGGGERVVEEGDPEAVRAAQMLERLRALTRSASTETLALPYASPSVPALARSGLIGDVERQIEHGRAVLEETLGAPIQQAILYPPGSGITADTLDAVPTDVATLLLNSETLPPPPELNLSPAATALLGRDRTAIVSDPGVATYLEAGEDPALAAQLALGELSAIYFEEPSVLRGAALLIEEAANPNPVFLGLLLRALSNPPPRSEWLRPTKASQLVAAVPPEERRRLRGPDPLPFSAAFVQDLRDGRDAIEQFESMTTVEVALPDRLRALLLIAESRDLAGRESTARQFIGAVRANLLREFSKVQPPSGSSVTLTSQGGVIPVTMRNGTGYDVRVRITLRSPGRLDFLEGASREVTLSSEAQALTFPVRAQTTGRFPVIIQVETPSGRRIAESRIVVRSTAYNRVALLITIGAAVFLAAWWGRRFLRRARS